MIVRLNVLTPSYRHNAATAAARPPGVPGSITPPVEPGGPLLLEDGGFLLLEDGGKLLTEST